MTTAETDRPPRLVLRFAVAFALFVAAAALPALLIRLGVGVFERVAWLPHFAVKTTLLVLTLAAVAIEGGNFRSLGLRRADPPARWGRIVGAGLLLGAAATVALALSPGAGMGKLLGGFGLPALVLSVWFFSSFTEELFVRGWFQGSLRSRAGWTFTLGGRTLSVPVAASALLFGAMHLSLLVKGIDLWTTAIIVVATTALGWLAATYRERHDSLWPAFVVHFCFNVGGALAGIAMAIARVAAGGGPPAS